MKYINDTYTLLRLRVYCVSYMLVVIRVLSYAVIYLFAIRMMMIMMMMAVIIISRWFVFVMFLNCFYAVSCILFAVFQNLSQYPCTCTCMDMNPSPNISYICIELFDAYNKYIHVFIYDVSHINAIYGYLNIQQSYNIAIFVCRCNYVLRCDWFGCCHSSFLSVLIKYTIFYFELKKKEEKGEEQEEKYQQ